jgi:putative ABC transport system ATP-binding protein
MIIKVSNARLKRGSGEEEFTLEVNDFSLGHGEFVSLLGPSGCGKSTMLDMLGLILKPVFAEVFDLEIEGHGIIRNAHRLGASELMRIRRRHFGYVLQSGGLISSMTVRDNIMVAVQFSDRRFDSERFRGLVELLDIGSLLQRKPRELSGGQRQRVAIARALVHKPAVVLADEPTAAIDHRLATDVCRALRDASKEVGSSIVMVTHNQDIGRSFSDRVIEYG